MLKMKQFALISSILDIFIPIFRHLNFDNEINDKVIKILV